LTHQLPPVVVVAVVVSRKWRKVAAMMSLKYQTRWRASWKELYVERDRVEKAYFHSPPTEMRDDSERGLYLYRGNSSLSPSLRFRSLGAVALLT
jgi:hypothetical protein